jgi:hypothetical protein
MKDFYTWIEIPSAKLYTFLGCTRSSCEKCNHVEPEPDAVILKVFLYENRHILTVLAAPTFE